MNPYQYILIDSKKRGKILKPKKISKKHLGSILALAFDPTGIFLATGDKEGLINIWDWECREIQKKLSLSFRESGKPIITGFDFFSHNTLLFSSFGQGVGAWSLREDQLEQIKGENDDFVEAACFYTTEKVIISDQHKVIVLDRKEGTNQIITKCRVRAVAVHREIVALACEERVLIINLKTNQQKTVKWEEVSCLKFSPDGERIIAGDKLGSVKMLNLISRHEITSVKAHKHLVKSVDFDSRRGLIISVSLDGIRLNHFFNHYEALIQGNDGFLSGTLHPNDRSSFVAGNRKGEVVQFDLEDI